MVVLATIECLVKKAISIIEAMGSSFMNPQQVRELLGLNNINAAELGHDFLDRMTIPNRMLKIANKDTKQCILDRPHVRVLADSDIPLKEQYKKIISR